MAKLDSLIVDLQLNTAELRKGLDQANAKLNDFGKKMDSLAGVVVFDKIASAAFDVSKALVTFTMHGAEAADKMGKMAQSSGTTTESFSRLNYAAALSNVSTDQLGASMLKLNKNLSEAATGSKTQVALFGALGVSVKDASGKVRSADDVMGDLAEQFAAMPDGASKARLATEVFGKAGADMIPLLNGGKAGLAELGAEADKFGITVSSSASKAAGDFNDNLTKMSLAFQAIATQAASQLAPAMVGLAEQLRNTQDGASTLSEAADVLATTLRLLVSAGVIVGAVFETVGKAIGRTASAVVDAASGNFDALLSLQSGYMADMAGATGSAMKKLDAVWSTATAKSEEHGKSLKVSSDAIVAQFVRAEEAAKKYDASLKTLTNVAVDYETKVSTFGFSELGLVEARLNAGDLADELANLGAGADNMKQRILDAAQALNDLKVDLQMGDIKFTVARAAVGVDQNTADRRDEHSRAASPVTGAYAAQVGAEKLNTKGFASFDAALSTLATQTKLNTKLLGDAELLKSQNDIEGSRAALMAADAAKRAADKAGLAADAFTSLTTDLAQAREKSIADAVGQGSWSDAIKVLKEDFETSLNSMPDFGAELSTWFTRMSGQLASSGVKMLGAVGELVDSIVKGAESGGVWGAVIAAFLEIAKRTKSALAFLDTALQFIEKIADMVEPLVAPIFKALQGVLEIVVDIVAPVFKALQPFFNAISQLIEDLSPVIWAIGDLFAAISPIIEFIGMLIGKIFEAIKPIFTIIAGFIRIIATIILGIIIAFNEIAAAFGDDKAKAEAARMKKMVEDMWDPEREQKASTSLNAREDPSNAPINSTGHITASGPIEMTDFDLSKFGLADGVFSGKVVDVGGNPYAAGSVAGAEAARAYVESAFVLSGGSVEEGAAQGQAAYDAFLALGGAASTAATALNKFSASLSNVPEGFKYQLRAFEAMNSGGAGSFSQTTARGSDIDRAINITVQGSVLSENALMDLIDSLRRKSNFRSTGSSLANLR